MTPGERETLVRFDLEPDGDGCALTLTPLGPGLNPDGGTRAAGCARGWHAHLAAITDALDGRRPRPSKRPGRGSRT